MPPRLGLAVALVLAACVDAPPPDASPAEVAPDTASVPARIEPISMPEQAPRPEGSAGTFTLSYIRSIDGERGSADTTRIEGHLPPPVTAAAFGAAKLDAVPDYTVSVKPSSVARGVALRESGFVFLIENEVGEVDAVLRRGDNTLAERVEGLFRGNVYAVTVPPLWKADGETPRLWLREKDREDVVLAEVPLPIAESPPWLQPVALPTVPQETRVTIALDLRMDDPGLVPVFVYPSFWGEVGWAADRPDLDTFRRGLRERAGETDLGLPYRLFLSQLDRTRSEAFLILFDP